MLQQPFSSAFPYQIPYFFASSKSIRFFFRLFIIAIVVSTCFINTAIGQSFSTDKKLTAELQSYLKKFHGQAGIYVYSFQQHKQVAIAADTVFPTASMVKVPILIALMDKIKAGELQYHQTFTYYDSLAYPGVDILASFKNGEKIELSKLILLMLSLSDNTASLWLQAIAGGGTRINNLMDSLGFTQTRVNSRTPGREAIRLQYGWGQTTPYEMAMILKRIASGTLLGQPYDDKMLRLLSRNYWDEEALSQIPANVFVASKNGAVDASRSEVLYVNGKKGSYVFCLCTNHNTDQSWETNNEAWALSRNISKLLWEYYH
ncbi:serine hydrolase [Hydrotalea sandarakina]|jgi:beta-lactamase class A|uniref:beta-lactamase n=1 Tax=Hydrotalea sandarakina TaxID=1004304 RepID=A0A2W7RQ57_9BACT|nr:serine hydrolase [Hydrotalea sandarakina]PZX60640.1 beta-lactamase class A [Hydrotalea sandarakina]